MEPYGALGIMGKGEIKPKDLQFVLRKELVSDAAICW